MQDKKEKQNKKPNPKALVLFSGGLDSRLAVKLLQEQKINIEAVFFQLIFGGGCCNDFSCVFNYSQVQGIKLHVIDCTKGKIFQEYLDIIKNPEHGTGTAINPCKDCKIFMFKQAKKLAKKINADFIVTGEVLGQRPMSQLKKQLELTEEQAGLKGQILRPLSAKLLSETKAEKKQLVNRNKLLDIEGRSRKRQMQLAEKFKIKYPSSGGGCLLCEKDYAKKLKDLFKHKKKIIPEEVKILNTGRHFRKNTKIILGKNQQENQVIEELNKKLKYPILIPETPGPTAIFEDKNNKLFVEKLIKAYSTNPKLRKKFEEFKI